MNEIVLCIAGKNDIAIKVLHYVQLNYPKIKVVACCNNNDHGINGFQRSYRRYCILNNIEILTLPELYKVDNLIFLSLEFDKIIKPTLFLSDKLFNIHFSYLPEYKGMYTSALPILHGKKYTGVTLHRIDAGIDTGEIISRRKIELENNLTAEDLYLLYILNGTDLVIENLDKLFVNTESSSSQPIENSSYYSKKTIDYSNLSVDLNKTANEISRQIRAYSFPAYQLPEIYGYRIYNTRFVFQKSTLKAGTIIENNEFFLTIASIDYNIQLLKDLRENLFDIAKSGDIQKLEHYINNSYDIKQRSKEGWDLAILAAYNGKIDFLVYLIEELNWNLHTTNYNGTTLTMYLMTHCCEKNKPEIFSNYMNKYHPNIRIKDFHGKDILYYAQKYKNEDILKIIHNNLK